MLFTLFQVCIDKILPAFLAGIGQMPFVKDKYLRRVVLTDIFKRWIDDLTCRVLLILTRCSRSRSPMPPRTSGVTWSS